MILVLGGTAEAHELAGELDATGVHVTSSLAGRVSRPRLPAGTVRVGGFGGPHALARWLTEHGASAVIDATHPFAERISESAATACPRADVPLLRLQRPGWSPGPGDNWHWVADLDAATAAISGLGERVRAAEAADAHGARRQAGVRDAPGERGGHVHAGGVQGVGELARLGGAAEHEDHAALRRSEPTNDRRPR